MRLTLGILFNAALLAAGLLLTLPQARQRTAYPNRPIKLIVPFAAGGGTDNFARVMKQAIDEQGLLPVPLAIINVGGAGATIGSRRVKNARPDGYTVLLLHDAIFTAELSGTVEYGPDSFTPIAGTGEVGLVIAVADDSPYHSLEELTQAARGSPNEINFGANLGALTHYAGLQLEHGWPGAKFRFSQVGGGADRYADLKGGHIDVTGFSIEEFVRFRPGGIRGLAYFGEAPHPAAPTVPPARTEDGAAIVSSNIFYWWFPENTPVDRIEFFADVLQEAMQTDYVQQKMREIQCEPVFLRGPELREHLNEASARYAAITPPQPVELPDFPALILIAVAVLAALVVGQEWRRRRRIAGLESAAHVSPPETASLRGTGPRNGLAGVCLAWTLLYVLAMSAAEIDFRIATLLYVLAVGMTLLRFQIRRLPSVLAAAQVMAFGLYFVLTRLFEVDLP